MRRYFPRSHEIFGRRKWQRSCSSRTRFSRTIWTLRALDKRQEDERLSVIPFFFFFFFFSEDVNFPGPRRWPDPERPTREDRGEGNKRGHRGRIHLVLRGREGAQKDGGPPFRCESAFPRPSAAMETDSARLESRGCDAGCRFLNPANETC